VIDPAAFRMRLLPVTGAFSLPGPLATAPLPEVL